MEDVDERAHSSSQSSSSANLTCCNFQESGEEDERTSDHRGQLMTPKRANDNETASDIKPSSAIDELESRVQNVLLQINENRTNDQDMIDTFQTRLSDNVSVVCQQAKEGMFALYEQNSVAMETRLTELSQVLSNCSVLLGELQGISQDLESLRTGLFHTED